MCIVRVNAFLLSSYLDAPPTGKGGAVIAEAEGGRRGFEKKR